jgi:hypothetical protein
MRVLVQKLHVGVRRSGIEIVIHLFDIFAVVAFMTGDAKKTLLQDIVLSVPES